MEQKQWVWVLTTEGAGGMIREVLGVFTNAMKAEALRNGYLAQDPRGRYDITIFPLDR